MHRIAEMRGWMQFIQLIVLTTSGLLNLAGGSAAAAEAPANQMAQQPFENDPAVLGRWESVDFVEREGDFNPGRKIFRGDLYLHDFVFAGNGQTHKPFWTWSKGKVYHSGDNTTARYFIKRIQGENYLFLEWMSGDVILRGQKPRLYVLHKTGEASPETVVSPIVKVSLFKNGLAQVRKIALAPGPGTFGLKNPPVPVHGTFWLDTRAKVEVVSGMRVVPFDPDDRELTPEQLQRMEQTEYQRLRLRNPSGMQQPESELVRALLGREAVITRRTPENGKSILSGIVQGEKNGMLMLRSSKGFVFLPLSEVLAIDATELNANAVSEQRMIEKPFMNLVVKEPNERAEIKLDYLTYGLTWAPSYQIDLSDSSNLRIEMKAEIRNEIEDLANVDCELITGYPNIKYANLLSLITAGLTLNDFLNPQNMQDGNRASNIQYNLQAFRKYEEARLSAHRVGGVSLSRQTSNTGGEGGDLFYKDIGKLTLKKNEATSLQLEFSNAQYEKIVEWTIPNTRAERGHIRPRNQNGNENDLAEENIWDAIIFKNPFTFPMTTAPSSFYKDGHFIGQSLATFANAGEETTLRVTTALSVRVNANEYEEQDGRERFVLFGNTLEKRKVKGELKLHNFRNAPVKVIIKKYISGAVLDAAQNPEKKVLADGIDELNQTWELKWTVTLQPGAELLLNYQYQVVVDV